MAKGRKVIQSFREGYIRYQKELVYCGKKNCSRCPHGPYWYAYIKTKHGEVCKYIGKELKLINQGKKENSGGIGQIKEKEGASG